MSVETVSQPNAPVLVFCSYSHHDHQFRLELEAQVSPLVRQKLITFWSDRRIGPGEAWEQAISRQLETADIVLLLISAYFVQSDYCYTTELQRALERDRRHEARVVPIFVRACDWEGLDFAHLQGLPAGGKPISAHADREEAWTEVVRGLRRIAIELQGIRGQPCLRALPTSSIKYDSSAYFRSLVAWHRAVFADTDEIPIYAHLGGRIVAVADALAEWLGPGPLGRRFAVISGDPGSGKTYALRSLASGLAARYMAGASSIVPLFIPARNLTTSNPAQALRNAIPEAGNVIDAVLSHGTGVILIDGLDEVPSQFGKQSLQVLIELVRITPQTLKIGVSCRPPLRDALVEALASLGDPPMDLRIQELSDAQMRQSFAEEDVASCAIASSIRQPFALKLLGLQLKLLGLRAEHGPLPLDLVDLYDRALKVWIDAELEKSVELNAVNRNDVWDLLLEAAEQMYGYGSVPLHGLRTLKIREPHRSALLNCLIAARVLYLDTQERLRFGHESIFDYFFARVLERDLSAWDATHLALANLIDDYNVNRFLVPILLRRPRCSPGGVARAVLRDLFAGAEARSAGIVSRPVTRDHFQTFMTDTGWRRGTGFGYWTIVQAPDGTSATAGGVLFDRATPKSRPAPQRGEISGVSWYDAQQFACWIGGSIPLAADCNPVPGMYQWTSEWWDEAKALIRLVDERSSAGVAVNPDVRSSNIGFRVQLPLDHSVQAL